MRLANWPFLLLLVLIPLLHRWWKFRNKPAKVTFSIPVPSASALKNPLNLILLLKYFAIGLCIFALARPQSGSIQVDRRVSGIDIFLVLDVSPSMNAEDLAERSRIEVAKDTIEDFVNGRHNDRIGLVIFSGEPLTMAPLALDHHLILSSLRNVTLGMLKEGTAIGDGLSLGVSHLKNSQAKSRVIVLLTDGDNNIGQVDPATAGELAAGYGIKVYSIAIGKEGPVRIPIHHKNIFGNNVVTYQMMNNALNPELLQQISKSTYGKFYRVTDEDALHSVFREIDQLEKSDIQSHERIEYEEMFSSPLKLGLMILLIQQILERVWWRILP